jgi:hypothetical protein
VPVDSQLGSLRGIPRCLTRGTLPWEVGFHTFRCDIRIASAKAQGRCIPAVWTTGRPRGVLAGNFGTCPTDEVLYEPMNEAPVSSD